MREKESARRYLKELAGTMGVYITILVLALHFGRPMQPGVLRLGVLISPMIGFGLMIWVIVRQFQRMDEFIRRLFLENTAIAAAITAAATFSYGFLETAGYPKLSMFTVWMVMGSAWGMIAIVRSLSNR
jgi:hypothetical protein